MSVSPLQAPLPQQREVTVGDLVAILFGNPITPEDTGVIGRMNARMDQLLRWARALTITFAAAFLALLGNLIVALHIVR